MTKELLIYAAIMLIGVFVSAIAQVLLKKEAALTHDSTIREYLNPRVICAYLIFFAATFLSIFAYQVVPLSMGAILESTGYLYVTIFGVLVFQEKINGTKLFALLLIIVGIIVYSLLG